MITSGFFESVGTDRTYGTDSFNTFFEGLISKDGIFEAVGNKFAVTPSTDLSFGVSVADGKALVNNHWVRSDATENIEIDAAHNLFDRWDMICLRWDAATRAITLEKTAGTPASSAIKPEPLRGIAQYEIVLAYIRIKANATAISSVDIIDCRYDDELCGIITGLIKQVDVTNLYRQYSAEFQRLTEAMLAWQTEQQAAYVTWFNTLTNELLVNNSLVRTIANYRTTREDGTQYIDLPESLNYEEGDILDVYLNGMLLVRGADYDLTLNEVENIPMIYIYADVDKDNLITFNCLKAQIGDLAGDIADDLTEILNLQNEILDDSVELMPIFPFEPEE